MRRIAAGFLFAFGLGVPASAGHAATIAVDGIHACATKNDGSLWCWGDDTYEEAGALPNPPTAFPFVEPAPVAVGPFNAGAVGVGEGWRTSFAVMADGSAWSWGANFHGEAGLGDFFAFPPAQLAIAPGVVGIAGGYLHGCAVGTDGSVWCWGQGPQGQIGALGASYVPAQVPSVPNSAIQIAAGNRHTCAVMADHSAWCWGDDTDGELGDGLFRTGEDAEVEVPSPVTALGNNVAQISAGGGTTCAVKLDGSAWCWGYSGNGELGDGTTTSNATPVAVTGLGSGVAEVSAGWGFTCAVKTDGSLWCWGWNQYGQLGNGTTTDSSIPVRASIANVVEVSTPNTAGWSACARKSDGSVWCWGLDNSGQLGDGDPNATGSSTPPLIKPAPVQVAGFGPLVAPAVPGSHPATVALLVLLLAAAAMGGIVGRRRT
jgi:alpha-tubulin suppressor-like RCC1 family protein